MQMVNMEVTREIVALGQLVHPRVNSRAYRGLLAESLTQFGADVACIPHLASCIAQVDRSQNMEQIEQIDLTQLERSGYFDQIWGHTGGFATRRTNQNE